MNRWLHQGDITTYGGTAIVNAANVRMLDGDGVTGAIHHAAGPGLLEECLKVPEVSPGIRCPTGEARLTPGANLKAKWVIHAAGPIFHGSPTARAPKHPGELAEMAAMRDRDPTALLEKTIRSCLELAVRHGFRDVAFPAISAGVFGGTVNGFAEALDVVLGEQAWDLDDLALFLFPELEHDAFVRCSRACENNWIRSKT